MLTENKNKSDFLQMAGKKQCWKTRDFCSWDSALKTSPILQRLDLIVQELSVFKKVMVSYSFLASNIWYYKMQNQHLGGMVFSSIPPFLQGFQDMFPLPHFIFITSLWGRRSWEIITDSDFPMSFWAKQICESRHPWSKSIGPFCTMESHWQNRIS